MTILFSSFRNVLESLRRADGFRRSSSTTSNVVGSVFGVGVQKQQQRGTKRHSEEAREDVKSSKEPMLNADHLMMSAGGGGVLHQLLGPTPNQLMTGQQQQQHPPLASPSTAASSVVVAAAATAIVAGSSQPLSSVPPSSKLCKRNTMSHRRKRFTAHCQTLQPQRPGKTTARKSTSAPHGTASTTALALTASTNSSASARLFSPLLASSSL